MVTPTGTLPTWPCAHCGLAIMYAERPNKYVHAESLHEDCTFIDRECGGCGSPFHNGRPCGFLRGLGIGLAIGFAAGVGFAALAPPQYGPFGSPIVGVQLWAASILSGSILGVILLGALIGESLSEKQYRRERLTASRVKQTDDKKE